MTQHRIVAWLIIEKSPDLFVGSADTDITTFENGGSDKAVIEANECFGANNWNRLELVAVKDTIEIQ